MLRNFFSTDAFSKMDLLERILVADDSEAFLAHMESWDFYDRDDEDRFLGEVLVLAHSLAAGGDGPVACLGVLFDDDPEMGLEARVYANRFTWLLADRRVPDEAVRYAAQTTPGLDFELTCTDIIRDDARQEITSLLDRAWRAFDGTFDREAVVNVIQACVEKANYTALAYLKARHRESSPFKDYDGECRPKYLVGASTLTSAELSAGLSGGVTPAVPREHVDAWMKQMLTVVGVHPSKRRMAMMVDAMLMSEPEDLPALLRGEPPAGGRFQILGPINSNDNSNCRFNCHMLTCNCNGRQADIADIDVELPANSAAWFLGACQVCDLRIVRSCYALRRPNHAGGWLGTYCSFKCMLGDNDEEPLIEKEMGLIRMLREQLWTRTILDRRD